MINKMIKLQTLLNNSKQFLKNINFLKIENNKIPSLLSEIQNNNLEFKESKKFLNLNPVFYLLIDGLNFCFWNFKAAKRFSYQNKTGSIALAFKIKDNLKFTNPDFLHKNALKFYKMLLKNTKGELLLPKQRILIIKEIGRFLKKYNLSKVLYDFQNKDVDLLANFLIQNMPYTFSDISYKNDIQFNFLKKIRLLISDLISLGGFRFKNKEKLLIFPDYGLPALFINKKIFNLDKKYLNKILNQKLIKHNSNLEIALRSATIVVGEIIKHNFKNMPYNEIDRRLWILYEKNKNELTHHLTLTRFY